MVILPAIYAITHSFVSGSQKKTLAGWAVLVKQKDSLPHFIIETQRAKNAFYSQTGPTL
jgi:hypothetical protein